MSGKYNYEQPMLSNKRNVRLVYSCLIQNSNIKNAFSDI